MNDSTLVKDGITSCISIPLSGKAGQKLKTVVDFDHRTVEMLIGKSIFSRNLWNTNNRYAFIKANGKTVLLHRYLMGVAFNNLKEVDHINGNTLDNRSCNLRVCNRDENAKNRLTGKNSETGYKGVYTIKGRLKYKEKNKDIKIYAARIQSDKEKIYLGQYSTPEEAAYVYDQVAMQLHGEFARTNFFYDNNEDQLDNPGQIIRTTSLC